MNAKYGRKTNCTILVDFLFLIIIPIGGLAMGRPGWW